VKISSVTGSAIGVPPSIKAAYYQEWCGHRPPRLRVRKSCKRTLGGQKRSSRSTRIYVTNLLGGTRSVQQELANGAVVRKGWAIGKE
jgi:hypothetical protein